MEEILKQFMELMSNKFEIMEKRFDNMESRFNKRFDEIDKRFDKIESDIKVIKDDVAILKDDVATIKEATNDNLTENRSYFKYIETKLDDQKYILKHIGNEIKKANIDIEYLLGKTGKHDAEIYSIIKRIQSLSN
jgi:hypothetical protein